MRHQRTAKQIQNLADRIEDDCNGDTTGLSDWLTEGNRTGGLTGRTDKSIIAEWNELTSQAGI